MVGFSKRKKDLLDTAEVFYQWVNEPLISMIFEYEKDSCKKIKVVYHNNNLQFINF